MTARQLEIIQHAIGADKFGRRKRYSERNHFCAGAADEPDCRALVALGLMSQHATTEIFPYFNCSVTEQMPRVLVASRQPCAAAGPEGASGMKRRTEISWWFPSGIRLVYSGTPKTRIEWIRLTWRAYLAAWRLGFRVLWLTRERDA